MKRQIKQEFGIERNGEHLERGFDSRESAEERAEKLRQEVQSFVKVGWITADQAKTIRYRVVEISRRRSW